MKRLFLPALLGVFGLLCSACDHQPATAPSADPTGRWEIRDDGLVQSDGSWPDKENYHFTRYDFKGDGTFEREIGNTVVPADARRVSGLWKVEPIESLTPSSGIGIRSGDDASPLARGTLVLSYTVQKKDDILPGATLLAERGPAMGPPHSFELQERHVIFLRDGSRLTVGDQTFRRVPP